MIRFHTALVLLAMPVFALAAPPAKTTLKEATTVLDELEAVPEKSIPQALINDAEAIVIIPNTVKAGFGVGGRIGHGVAIIKDKNGDWSEIRFLTLGGASVGFQVGVEVTDVVLVFKNRKGLDRLLDGKTKLTLGTDASVAAGPVGRKASVSTDGALKSEIWSYSRSRGLFAGVALDGAVLVADTDKNDTYAKKRKRRRPQGNRRVQAEGCKHHRWQRGDDDLRDCTKRDAASRWSGTRTEVSLPTDQEVLPEVGRVD